MKINTDDISLKKFLNTLCHNCLTEHVSAVFLPESIAEIILNNVNLHNESIDFLSENSTLETKKLTSLLEEASDEKIIALMNYLFSKKLLIDSLLEYTDEYAREEIIENQLNWNCNVGDSIFL